jgi:5'-nucleotidase
VTAQFLNMLKADAMTIGNHEFDHDVEGVVPFLEHITSPVVIANVDDALEPTFQNKYTKSIVIDKYNRKIGVIGAILRSTNTIAKTGKLSFTNEAQAVREEAEKMKAAGINIVIVLTHCGLDRDREIARLAGPNIDIIVGGHSHSFLFSGENLPSLDKPADNYPVVETQPDGHRVLIVQASAYTKYVGEITLYFDDEGIVQHWEGEPIFLGPEVVPDAQVLEAIQPWKQIVDASGKRVVGSIKITAGATDCYQKECLMGTLQAESMLHSVLDNESDDDGWTYATIALTNPGGVRGSLSNGELTYSDLVTTTPFENTVDSMELEGKYIRQALEFSARSDNPSILQVAGIRVVFNMTKPAYSKIVSLDVLCRLCEVPRYDPINDDKWYRIVVNNFLLMNGDNFAMIRDNGINHKVGAIDIDALTNYVEKYSPIAVVTPLSRISFV